MKQDDLVYVGHMRDVAQRNGMVGLRDAVAEMRRILDAVCP